MDYCLLETVGLRFTNAELDGMCKGTLSRGVREEGQIMTANNSGVRYNDHWGVEWDYFQCEDLSKEFRIVIVWSVGTKIYWEGFTACKQGNVRMVRPGF